MNPKKDEVDEKDTGFVITSIIVTIVIIGLWWLTYYLLKDLGETKRGTFGDMFGSINALFSGLALAGIILTILLQRKELRFQREELKETRKEFETQNETLKLQRFENTFFNLLNLHHQIVDAIDYRYYKRKEREVSMPMFKPDEEKEAVTLTGRDVFRHRYNLMKAEQQEDLKKYEQIYLKHYEFAQTDFGHYFRNLYRMIKLVDQTDFFYDQSKAKPEEIFEMKYKYTSIIRSQLSDYELLWLFYNCLSANGKEKFKPYIEKYSLFKNLPVKLLANKSHKDLYDDRAFKPKV
jgi:hypothetical protein